MWRVVVGLCVGLCAPWTHAMVAVRAAPVHKHVPKDRPAAWWCSRVVSFMPTAGLLAGQGYALCYYWGPGIAEPGGRRPMGLGLRPGGNWYWKGAGFLRVLVNGTEPFGHAQAEVQVRAQGTKGIATFAWDVPQGRLSADLAMIETDDKLMVRLTLAPRVEVKTLELRLLNLPFYAYMPRPGGRREPGRRDIRAAGLVATNGQTPDLDPKRQWWVYYGDRVIRWNAPSALAFVPGQPSAVRLSISGSVSTRLHYPPTTREIRFALWQFRNGTSNADGLRHFQSRTRDSLLDLLQEDFQPVR